MGESEGSKRLGRWASAALALGATVATSAPHCPMDVQFEETVVLDATTLERTLRFFVRASLTPGVGVHLTLAPQGSTEARVEVVLLHEGSTSQPDEFVTLHAAAGTTATARLPASSTFRVGLTSLNPEPTSVHVRVSVSIDDCDEDRFVTIDRE